MWGRQMNVRVREKMRKRERRLKEGWNLEASNYENVTGFKISFLTSSFQILNFFISSVEKDASQIFNQTNLEIRDRRGCRVV